MKAEIFRIFSFFFLKFFYTRKEMQAKIFRIFRIFRFFFWKFSIYINKWKLKFSEFSGFFLKIFYIHKQVRIFAVFSEKFYSNLGGATARLKNWIWRAMIGDTCQHFDFGGATVGALQQAWKIDMWCSMLPSIWQHFHFGALQQAWTTVVLAVLYVEQDNVF